jgi:hypothetical protein
MLSDVRTQLRSKTLLEKGGRSPPSIPHAQSINYYDILHTVPCSPLCRALICTCKYSPLWSTLPCSHMYLYLQSLTVHSAVLSHVLVPTVPCGPLCHAFKCTHTYSPLQSTLPFLAVHSAVLSCVLKLHRRQSTYVTHRLRDLLLTFMVPFQHRRIILAYLP